MLLKEILNFDRTDFYLAPEIIADFCGFYLNFREKIKNSSFNRFEELNKRRDTLITNIAKICYDKKISNQDKIDLIETMLNIKLKDYDYTYADKYPNEKFLSLHFNVSLYRALNLDYIARHIDPSKVVTIIPFGRSVNDYKFSHYSTLLLSKLNMDIDENIEQMNHILYYSLKMLKYHNAPRKCAFDKSINLAPYILPIAQKTNENLNMNKEEVERVDIFNYFLDHIDKKFYFEFIQKYLEYDIQEKIAA